jgi:hypothetical protein
MPTPGTSQLPAVAVPGRSGDYLAKAGVGEATFLLGSLSPTAIKPPLRLRYIEIDFGAPCRVKEEGASEVQGQFIAIRCVDVDALGLELFIRAVGSLIATLPIKPSPSQAESLIAAIVELFRKFTQPPKRSVKGLWAELFLIFRSQASERMIASWHVESDEKFDFLTAKGYVEVKATELPSRIHEFALSQLRGERSNHGLIASLRLRKAAGGIGVLQLARGISARLRDTTLRRKLWANVIETMGDDFAEADINFDQRFAEANLIVVASNSVPCIDERLPVGVVDARLTIDFSHIPSTSYLAASALDELFR